MAGRGGIDALLVLMDEAFRGAGIEESNESQALLTNLATVTDDGQVVGLITISDVLQRLLVR